MANQSNGRSISEGHLYLIGRGVTHSIAPPMHNKISRSLSLPWTFSAAEHPTISSVRKTLHEPSFVGAVITMPYKQAVIPLLSGIDPHASLIGAVNNVYLTPGPERQLRGTNTDWEGIRGCLLGADKEGKGRGRPSLVVGAGGASRAAVYALSREFDCKVIYVINRDEGEVTQLLTDTRAYGGEDLKIVHVTSMAQARALPKPFYVVGTVPDIEPKSESELTTRDVLEVFLDRGKEEEKGVLLDMCFKPRNTRMLKLGRKKDWRCVEGTEIIGHQIGTQWGLWTREGRGGADADEWKVIEEEAWRVLRREAEESTMINF